MSDQPPGNEPITKEDFLYRPAKYRGQFTPESLVFNANLQEFARRIGFVCDLETGGKITSAEAYTRIRELWETLDLSGHNLGIDPTRPSA